MVCVCVGVWGGRKWVEANGRKPEVALARGSRQDPSVGCYTAHDRAKWPAMGDGVLLSASYELSFGGPVV